MSTSPSLLRRWDRTGIPLLIARLVLGGMFVWMGAAKTGAPEVVLKKAGVQDSPAVNRVLDSGLIELGGPVHFLKLIREYDMFPPQLWWLLNFTAVVMPWVEVACGLLLILGVALRGASLTLLGLLVMFTIMVTLRALHIHETQDTPFCAIRFNCGCGGGDVLACHKIPENLGLIALSLIVLISRANRFCLKRDLVPARAASTPLSSSAHAS